jgi:nucleoside-diphosphate-sugar epimerase
LAEYELEKNININSNIDLIILRPRGIYGVNDTTLLPHILKNIQYIPYLGDNQISLTHVDNLIHAIELCIDKNNSINHNNLINTNNLSKIYNISDDQIYNTDKVLDSIANIKNIKRHKNKSFLFLNRLFILFLGSISQICQIVCELFGIKFKSSFSLYSISMLSNNCTLDISKAKNNLGYKPNIKNDIFSVLDQIKSKS